MIYIAYAYLFMYVMAGLLPVLSGLVLWEILGNAPLFVWLLGIPLGATAAPAYKYFKED